MKKYSDWYYIREAEENGLMVTMNNIVELVERKRTELNKKLETYLQNKLKNIITVFDEDQCDDLLYSLNEFIKINNITKFNRELDFPISEGTDIHLLPITENLHLKIDIADEYYGRGEYEKYIVIDKFMINENTDEQDVDKLILFCKEYLLTV